MFWSLFGLTQLKTVREGQLKSFTKAVGECLLMFYHTMAVIVLINMLIAMMSNSFQEIEVQPSKINGKRSFCLPRSRTWTCGQWACCSPHSIVRFTDSTFPGWTPPLWRSFGPCLVSSTWMSWNWRWEASKASARFCSACTTWQPGSSSWTCSLPWCPSPSTSPWWGVLRSNDVFTFILFFSLKINTFLHDCLPNKRELLTDDKFSRQVIPFH